MARINAKRELLVQINNHNLEIIKIDCIHRDYDKNTEIPCTTLEDLDFNYENNYGGDPHLSGKIYCINKESEDIVWLERRDYDGWYYWHLNEIPPYVKEYIINNDKSWIREW